MGAAEGHDAVHLQAERAAVGSVPGYLEQLASTLGGRASVSAVFGEPVEGPGATVIPVARVRWVAGGGLGQGGKGLDVGEGGGGGGLVSAVPVGYIEIRDGIASFRPIHRSPTELLRPSALVAAAFLIRHLIRHRSRQGDR